ncbi:MAG: sugar phosphate isomerase/epimerase [Clostridia bacterium]|nr:sugar phosphate isomerase/epimerase [Clostridia bacterium]
MRLSFSTLPVQDKDGKELLALCQRHSMKAEIRTAPDGSFPYTEGLPVTNAGTGICLLGYDEAQLAKADEQLALVARRGIAAARVFLGNFRMRYDAPCRPIDEEGIVRALRHLAKSDVDIWIETHNEYATSKSLVPLLEKVGCENVGIVWDIAHPIEDGESVTETWRNLHDKIKQIHIKDAKPHPDPAFHDWYYTKLGEGELPIGEVVECTQKSGYSGYYSLEWETLWRPEIKDAYSDVNALLCEYRSFMEGLLK